MRVGVVLVLAAGLGGCSLGSRPAPRVAWVAPNLACIEHPLVDAWETRLRTERPRRGATEHELVRAGAALERLAEALTAAGVPPGLAVLPVVGGPTTSRLGLGPSARRADRARFERAARAVSQYLRSLHDRYEDWPLALAAYDAGVDRVDVARAGAPGADFWQLAAERRLPRATRDFVPRLLATIRLREGRAGCHHATTVEAAAPPSGPAAAPPMITRGRGLSFRRRLTPQSAVALTAGSAPRPVAPDMRITLGFQYSF